MWNDFLRLYEMKKTNKISDADLRKLPEESVFFPFPQLTNEYM